jgi:hypothetical protein
MKNGGAFILIPRFGHINKLTNVLKANKINSYDMNNNYAIIEPRETYL